MKSLVDTDYESLSYLFRFITEPSIVKTFMAVQWYDYAIKIMKKSNLAHGTINGAVHQLVKMGLIKSVKSGRIMYLSYTESGKQLFIFLKMASDHMNSIYNSPSSSDK